jgi:hypothetical protein
LTGVADQTVACGSCDGNVGVIAYTAEGGQNTLDVQAKLSPATVPAFVIGDVEPQAPGPASTSGLRSGGRATS